MTAIASADVDRNREPAPDHTAWSNPAVRALAIRYRLTDNLARTIAELAAIGREVRQ